MTVLGVPAVPVVDDTGRGDQECTEGAQIQSNGPKRRGIAFPGLVSGGRGGGNKHSGVYGTSGGYVYVDDRCVQQVGSSMCINSGRFG